MPKRIQLTKDVPENTIYVGPCSKWGNPWHIEQFGRVQAYVYFEAAMKNQATEWGEGAHYINPPQGDLSELRGKDLACLCPLNQPCHASILLELANTVND